jgi:hypothetical protein
MLLRLSALALLALAASPAAAAPPKVLACGARQNGVGGTQATVLKTVPGLQRVVRGRRDAN